jgi:hypothetical protein
VIAIAKSGLSLENDTPVQCTTVDPERKGMVGLRPSFSSHVRWGERGAPVQSGEARSRLEGETCGIPHLAKNERDMGHPAIAEGIEAKRLFVR